MDTHNLLLARPNEGIFAILTVNLSNDILNNVVDRDTFVMTRLMNALTAWRDYTEEGMEAWKESAEDFNVGDLSVYVGNASLEKYLNDHYINSVEIESYNADGAVGNYDKVLINPREGDQAIIAKINSVLEWIDGGVMFIESNTEDVDKLSIRPNVDHTAVSYNMSKDIVSFQELNFTVADLYYSKMNGNNGNIQLGGYEFTRLKKG